MESVIFNPFNILPQTIIINEVVINTREYFYICKKEQKFVLFISNMTSYILDKYMLIDDVSTINLQTYFSALLSTIPKNFTILLMIKNMLDCFVKYYNMNKSLINEQTSLKISFLNTTTNYDTLIDSLSILTYDVYYNKILDVTDAIIICINNVIAELPKNQFSHHIIEDIIISPSGFNNIHILDKFIAGTCNSIRTLCSLNSHKLKLDYFQFKLRNHTMVTCNMIIIYINYGYYISNIFYDYKNNSYVQNISHIYNKKIQQSKKKEYIYETSIWLLDEFLDIFCSSNKSSCEYLFMYNFFGASYDVIANTKFSKSNGNYIYLIHFFPYFKENCQMSFIENLIHSIDLNKINESDLNKFYCDIRTTMFDDHLADVFILDKILISPKPINYFNIIIDYAIRKASLNIIGINSSVDMNEDEKIIEPDKIIQKIKNNVLPPVKRTSLIVEERNRYVPNLSTRNHGCSSGGIGVRRSVMNDLLTIALNKISKNNKIQLDISNKQMEFYDYGVMYAVVLISRIANIIPQYMYNYIFDKEITLEMVMGSTFVKNLQTIKKLSDNELECLFLTMTIPVTEGDKYIEFELIEGGKDIQVTIDNVDQYIRLITDFYTFKNINSPTYLNIKAFNEGFQMVFTLDSSVTKVNKEIIYKCLTTINSFPVIQITDIKNIISCSNSTNRIRMLQYLSSLDTLKFKKFLKLTTGLYFLTNGEKIHIYVTSREPSYFPTLSVCSREIHMPNYSTYDEFVAKMDYLVDNIRGFQKS